ncbi:hypothetical protein C8F01DRAFT_1188479 [Mycena amicta]|nr:hypothetical protein C8F01DRAFT_1188479 [Mycena amicta]
MPEKTILFIGATGYIGGTVLWKLLQLLKSSDESTKIVALVRDPDKAQKLKAFGVDVVQGDTSDVGLLERLAKDADVVFSLAESDNVVSAKALLAGCKRRFAEKGVPTTFIHASGVGAIADMTTMGMHGNATIWDDADEDQMATIAPTQLHRPVDLELLAADDQGYINSYIVLPTIVFGIASTPLVDAGVQRPENTLFTHIVPPAVARGRGGFIGEGKNVWDSVEVHEVADLFILIYSASVASNPTLTHGRTGLYFAEHGGGYTLREIADVIAQTLFEHGKSDSADATAFSEEELDRYFPVPILIKLIASNAKCRASKARSALGWTPIKGTVDFLESAREITRNYILFGKPA